MNQLVQIFLLNIVKTLELQLQSMNAIIINLTISSLITKFSVQIVKITRFMDKNVSIGGTQFAKWQNLKMHDFGSTLRNKTRPSTKYIKTCSNQ